MKIPLDKTRIPSSVTEFNKISNIKVEKEELFKLGIFKHEAPPNHIHDSDYFYLMSKIPAYIELYSDFITVDKNQIINTSTDDRNMKDVSEIIGIALGLKLTIDCFGIRQEIITKIPPPITKQKYLDYTFTINGKRYELETKGTTSPSISNFVKDIVAKKASSTAFFRYGTVSVISKPNMTNTTKVHLCDDPPIETGIIEDGNDEPWHYLSAFQYILDNKHFNELVRKVIEGKKPRKNFIAFKKRFFGQYVFQGESYFGEFFDYRLNIEHVSAVVKNRKSSINQIFDQLTRKRGRKKIFIGVHAKIIDRILRGSGLSEILKLQFHKIKEISNNGLDIFRDSDGIIVVMSPDKNDQQFDDQFPESEVKKRLGQLVKFEQGESTECGEPCQSKSIKGKPCEILTYRGKCHYHR